MKNKQREADLKTAYQAIHKVMDAGNPADPMRIAHDHCLRELVALCPPPKSGGLYKI